MLVRVAWISPHPAGVALTVRYLSEVEGLAQLHRLRGSALFTSIRSAHARGAETREEVFTSYDRAARREHELQSKPVPEIATP
jgi:hypothetical protein